MQHVKLLTNYWNFVSFNAPHNTPRRTTRDSYSRASAAVSWLYSIAAASATADAAAATTAAAAAMALVF